MLRIAYFEYAATRSSEAIKNVPFHVQRSMTEYDAVQQVELSGFPLTRHLSGSHRSTRCALQDKEETMERPIPLSWLDPRVAIHPSPIAGRGLFAHDAIREGDVVEVWGGIRITDNELDAIARRMRKYNSAAIGEGSNVLLDLDDPIGFGNHSCDPNLWMGDAITVVARRGIASNEELTIDYATHTVSSSWRMICQCGSPLCRHVITGDDWQRAELQERYQDHFSPFINERIRGLRSAR